MSELKRVHEQAAFFGIRTARRTTLTAFVTLEVRDDVGAVRQQAAVAALQGLAAGLRVAFLDNQAEPASGLHLQTEQLELRS